MLLKTVDPLFFLSVIFEKKNVFHFGRDPTVTPFLHKLAPKIAIFVGFTNFFQNYWIATQLNTLTYFIGNQRKEKNGCGASGNSVPDLVHCCEKYKENGIINRLF